MQYCFLRSMLFWVNLHAVWDMAWTLAYTLDANSTECLCESSSTVPGGSAILGNMSTIISECLLDAIRRKKNETSGSLIYINHRLVPFTKHLSFFGPSSPKLAHKLLQKDTSTYVFLCVGLTGNLNLLFNPPKVVSFSTYRRLEQPGGGRL